MSTNSHCYFNEGCKERTALKLSVASAQFGLPDHLVSELVGSATPHALKAGESLFHVGDVGDGCYRLDKGMLKISLTSPQAEERILAILTSGAIVGDLAMIDALPRSASVVAMTDCELRFISRGVFEHVTQQHPEIYQYLVKVLAARLREADETIASLAFLTLKGRVARTLLELAENLGEENDSGAILIPRMFNQSDLAAMSGIARENVNRILADFERRGLVTKLARSYLIKDKVKLEHEINL